jgi:hypothetical protein
MLTVLTGVPSLTGTGVSVNLVNTDSIVLTGIPFTIINIGVTVASGPAWLTDALVGVQLINTQSSDTWLSLA